VSEPDLPSFRPAAIAAVLNRHQVRYVVIGAFAAIAQQAPIPATRDASLAPAYARCDWQRRAVCVNPPGRA
jgi:hypothetical protein